MSYHWTICAYARHTAVTACRRSRAVIAGTTVYDRSAPDSTLALSRGTLPHLGHPEDKPGKAGPPTSTARLIVCTTDTSGWGLC